MIVKRLISGFVACSLALTLLPQMTLPAMAAESSSGRVNWTGYNERALDFDVWDGTSYDTSWYTQYEGTASDPYIIDSAADLAGLQYLTNDASNIGYGKVTPLTTLATNLTNSRYFALYDASKEPTDPSAWYYVYDSDFINFSIYDTFDVVEYTVETSIGNYASAAYLDNYTAYMVINGQELVIPIEDPLEYCTQYNRRFFEPAKDYSETGEYPSYIEYSYLSGYIDEGQNSRIASFTPYIWDYNVRNNTFIKKYLFIDWNTEEYYLALPRDNDVTDILRYDFSGRDLFSGMYAINAYGEKISLSGLDHSRYIAYTSSTSNFSGVQNAVSGYPVVNDLESTGFNIFTGKMGITTCTRSSGEGMGYATPKVFFTCGYGELSDYTYFQDTTISTDAWYNATDSLVYASHFGAPMYTVQVYWTEGADWRSVDITLELLEDGVVIASDTWNADTTWYGESTAFTGYQVEVSFDEATSTLTASIPKTMKMGTNAYGATCTIGYTADCTVSAVLSHSSGAVQLYDLSGTATETYTDDGRYKIISSNFVAPANFLTRTNAWATEVARLAAINASALPNPSFEGKYFKLAKDIDISAAELTLFPGNYTGSHGLACTFDMNGYAITGVRANLINTIAKDGVLKNGHIELAAYTSLSSSAGVINQNDGVIENMRFYTNSLLSSEGTITLLNRSNYYTYSFIGKNNGLVQDCDWYTSIYSTESFVNSNYSEVSAIDILYVEPESLDEAAFDSAANYSPASYTTNSYVCSNNAGLITDVHIDADEDVIGTFDSYYTYHYKCIDGASGRVDGFYIANFTIDNIAYNIVVPIAGAVNNFESYVSYNKSDLVNSWYYSSDTFLCSSLSNSVVDMYSDWLPLHSSRPCSFYNCDIKLRGYTGAAGSGNYLINFFDIEGCSFDFELSPSINGSHTLSSFFYSGNTTTPLTDVVIKDTDIRVSASGYTGAPAYAYIHTVNNIDYKGGLENCNVTFEGLPTNTGIGTYIMATSFKDSTVNCTVDSGNILAPVAGSPRCDIDNSVISMECSGSLLQSNSDTYGGSGDQIVLKNSEYYVHFTEDAEFRKTNTTYGLRAFQISGLHNSLVCVTCDSDNVVFEDQLFMVANAYTTGTGQSYFYDSTVLVDGVTLSGPDAAIFAYPTGYGGDFLRGLRNLTILARDIKTTPLSSGTPEQGVSVFDLISSSGYSGTALNGLYMDIQFADGFENTPLMGIHLRSSYQQNVALANVYLTSNTTSPKSALTGGIGLHFAPYYTTGVILANSFLDLPNAQQSVVPSETAEGITPGVATLAGNPYYPAYRYKEAWMQDATTYAGGYLMMEKIALNNVLIPEGHSAVAQYYAPDTTTLDSWNIGARLGEIHGSLTSEDVPENYGVVESALDNVDVVYFDTSDASCYTDGSLAYALDNGSSQYRRGQAWTVVEEFNIKNPFTDEVVWEQEAFTGLCGMYLPEKTLLEYDINLSPVYKLTMLPADGGAVEVLGLGDKTTSDGSVYVKRNTSIPTSETVNDPSLTFAYATQRFYDGVTSRIPSTAGTQPRAFSLRSADPTAYTINGYTVYSADTTIQPVFGTARYITVDIEGDENGTVVPSTYTSIAGETIRLNLDVAAGYTITNLAINGTPLTEMQFIMPDADVEITGEVIPFEGGITSFSVFGFDGLIDQINHTISVVIPKLGDITNIAPEIEWSGKYISPAEDARVDFTSPVVYTVTKDDDTTVDYTVSVNQSTYTMRLYEFELNGVAGKINHSTRQVIVELPAETDLSAVVPTSIVYSAEGITPAEDAAQDFRAPVVYTLSTAGIQSVQYTVTVRTLGSNEAFIDEYIYSGYSGVIDDEAGTITLNIPALLGIEDIVPSAISYGGKSISPSKVSEVTLTEDVNTTATYTVTAQNNSTKTYAVVANLLSDDTAKITSFELGGAEGIIDEGSKTISIVVSETVDLVDIIPDELVFEGKSIYPNPTVERDFTQPQTYTVVAVDNSEVTYTIEVTRQKNGAEITEFEILGYPGVIDPVTKTITVELPYGTDVSDVPPSKVVYSDGATIEPDVTEKQDFTEPVEYTVESEDGLNENTYTVIADVADQYDNFITEFKLDGVNGSITNIGANLGTITINIRDYIGAPDWSNIAPDLITISDGATIDYPASTPRDFTTSLLYTVTGRLSGDRVYTVSLNVEPMDTTAIITKFVANNYEGIIDQAAGTIKVRVPESERAAMTAVEPTIVWQGASLTPLGVVDMTSSGITYTVTAEDPRVSKDYVMSVEWVDDSEPLDTTAVITKFKAGSYTAVIDQADKTISLTIPAEKKDSFVSVTPVITWEGEAISPEGAVDLTDDTLKYTVFAEDPSVTVVYTVDVTWKVEDDPVPPRPIVPVPSTECGITYYKALGIAADIDQDNLIISLPIPMSMADALEGVIPDSIIWKGKSLEPSSSTAVTLRDGLTYTVTAENTAYKKTYTLKIDWVDDRDTACRIISYTSMGVSGIVNQEAGTIVLEVPESEHGTWTRVVPDSIVWVGSSLTPTENTAVDLESGVTYRVYAENSDVYKDYFVKVDWVEDDTDETDEPVVPDDPEEPDAPDEPDTPDDTKEPEDPEIVDEPDDPEDPEEPEDNPYTGVSDDPSKLNIQLILASLVAAGFAMAMRKRKV